MTSNIFSSMTQLLKVVVAALIIALSLTSDTALTSTAETAQYLSNNSANCESSGQKPKSSEYQNWTFQPVMPLSESTKK